MEAVHQPVDQSPQHEIPSTQARRAQKDYIGESELELVCHEGSEVCNWVVSEADHEHYVAEQQLPLGTLCLWSGTHDFYSQ